MPPQLKRLLPLFAVFVVLFLVARYLLIPDSFGEHGHYRYKSVNENKEKTLHYAGKAMCADCHEERVSDLASGEHANISCETCHGPALAHANLEDSATLILPKTREFCGLCHSFNPTRKLRVIAQVDLNDHNVGKNCIDCHNPHVPWDLKEEE
jgi:hypothetical protein